MSTTTTPTVTEISPNKGSLAGNTPVTIAGTGFISGATTVNFGLAGASSIKVISDKLITVTSPNTGTVGAVDVTVIVQGVSSATNSADKFNYIPPTVTGISPSSGSLAGGATITITGTGLRGAEAVNFGLAGASNIKVISDTEITVTNPNSIAASVDVTVIVQGVTSATSSADKFTYNTALSPAVPILFSGKSLSTTFIQFLGGSVVGSYYDNTGTLQTLQPYTAYSLQSIASGTSVAPNLPNDVPAVLVSSFSGRLYISFGSGLQGMSATYIPAAQNPNDPNYSARYQYFEPTILNSQINVDLSYIDFTAISLSLNAANAPHASNGDQISESSLSMANAAGASATSTNGSVLPQPADQLPASAFARVISPQLGAAGLYHDFTHYLQSTLSKATLRLKGIYIGTGSQPTGNPDTQAQSYDFTATFDSSGNVTMVPNQGSGNGHSEGVPPVQQGIGVGDTTQISMNFSDLNASSGIYGCNAPYTLNTTPVIATTGITNDFWGKVVGDLLAGLNFGYVGSTVVFNTNPIGSLNSTQWWGGTLPDGTVVNANETPGGQRIYFSGAQSNPLDYNSYAGSISALTSGYGFPLQDRLGDNLMAMNTATDPGSYLMVWVDMTPVS